MQADEVERSGEPTDSPKARMVQQQMMRLRARFQPELSFPLLIHTLCHVEAFPAESSLADTAEQGPDGVLKLLAP